MVEILLVIIYLAEVAKENSNNKDIFFLAWTTTPWTLPSNLG